MTRTIQVEMELSDELLTNAIVCAVEGGTGYWAKVSGYDWSENGQFAVAYLHEMDAYTDEIPEQGQRFGLDEAATGITRIMSGQVPVADYIVGYIRRAITESDPGHIDCEAADVIAQAAILGELRYG
jgi:hypothetical protein